LKGKAVLFRSVLTEGLLYNHQNVCWGVFIRHKRDCTVAKQVHRLLSAVMDGLPGEDWHHEKKDSTFNLHKNGSEVYQTVVPNTDLHLDM
jgi:hypothetical protein